MSGDGIMDLEGTLGEGGAISSGGGGRRVGGQGVEEIGRGFGVLFGESIIISYLWAVFLIIVSCSESFE